MGGRGASSATATSSGIYLGSEPSKMSDGQIFSRIKRLDDEMVILGDTMFRYGTESASYLNGVPGAKKENHEKYVKARTEYQKLRYERDSLLIEQASRRPKAKVDDSRTFVNSFGEATDRYITSASYERAQRANEREILSRMKGLR